jgi:cation diffusion facilitator family transporter
VVPATYLVLVLTLTAMITVAELVLAQLTHCISLLVLVHQNIYNTLTLIVSCVTRWKGEESLVNTFGWRRMEVVGSLSSLVFLFSLCFATAIEALQTLFHNDHLDTLHHPDWIIFLLAANLVVWLVSLFTLGGYSHHQKKSVRLDKCCGRAGEKTKKCCSVIHLQRFTTSELTRDLGGCVFTFISSILVYKEVLAEKFSAYIDPVIALIYIIFFISSCVNITKDSCLILLQTIPGNVDISLLKTFLLKKFPGILSLHEFHTWTFTPGTLVCTGHITYQDKEVYTKISGQVEAFLYSQGFSKVTLQPEFPSSSEDIEEVEGCNLKCKHEECAEITCCNEEDEPLPTVEESGGIFYLSERPSVTERVRLSVTERPEERES